MGVGFKGSLGVRGLHNSRIWPKSEGLGFGVEESGFERACKNLHALRWHGF